MKAVVAPDTLQTKDKEEYESASRKAAEDYEVIQVWTVNGHFYARLQNVRTGKYVTFTET